jgi:thymidylate kinase
MTFAQMASTMTNKVEPASSVLPGSLMSLFQELDHQAIRYCHWKSNIRLDLALGGQTDLDLLVDRTRSRAFRQILEAHNVKPLIPPPGRTYPAIESYLGFDRANGKLFHLHVHYQLVLGEQFVKNYRIPVEEHILNSTRSLHGIRVPSPEWELIILSMRALLKYRDRNAVRDILGTRLPGLPSSIRAEFEWLLSQTSLRQVSQVLDEVSDILPADIVSETLKTVVTNPRPGFKLLQLRQRLRQALRRYQRQSRFRAFLQYSQERFIRHKVVRRILPERRMTPRTGGQSLAFVGADGAGKSTMVREIHKWLAWKVDVRSLYLGSKQPSLRSKLAYQCVRLVRRSWRIAVSTTGEQSILTRFLNFLLHTGIDVHHLSIAQDRYNRSLEGRRRADSGSIVIYDRFPLDVSLDGPKIQTQDKNRAHRFTKTIAQMEQELYSKISPPDHFVLLDVSPAVSMQRKPDHNPAAIATKSQVIRALATDGNHASKAKIIRIDADRPFDEVLSALKCAIWQLL